MENQINIGSLDTKITVQSVTQTLGDRGQKKVIIANHSEVFANIERRNNEMIDDGNLESQDVVEVTMYKIPSLTTRWRLLIADVPYEITAIDPITRFSPFCTVTARTIQK